MKIFKSFKDWSTILTVIGLVASVAVVILLAHRYVENNFTLKEIQITGVSSKLQDQIKKRLPTLIGSPTGQINLKKIQQEVNTVALVKASSVRLCGPSIICIKIVQKNPLFIWQTDSSEFFVVNGEDRILRKANSKDYRNLITIRAQGAPVEFSDELRFFIYSYNSLANLVESAVYNGYWWVLQLSTGTKIYLPVDKLEQATMTLMKDNLKYQILQRQLEYIDVRVPNKIFVRPT